MLYSAYKSVITLVHVTKVPFTAKSLGADHLTSDGRGGGGGG